MLSLLRLRNVATGSAPGGCQIPDVRLSSRCAAAGRRVLPRSRRIRPQIRREPVQVGLVAGDAHRSADSARRREADHADVVIEGRPRPELATDSVSGEIVKATSPAPGLQKQPVRSEIVWRRATRST